MKVSEQWLREWVNPNISSEELASQLTMAGLEVDAVETAAEKFSGVKVGLVTSTAKHPNAEKLTLCKVDVGEAEPLDIVCGAANVREGIKVAVATIGAELAGGFKIKKAKLRGEVSMGMLCSESELTLADSSAGIMELPAESPVGVDLRTFLNLDDQLIEIDFTPNRGDCLSVRGVAREIAALNDSPLTEATLDAIAGDESITIDVEVAEPSYCPSYHCRLIKNIDNQAQVPLWMKEKLRRSDLRSRSLVVDITNYVMMEYGQPMHAFDADKVVGKLVVRLAHENESLILLDGQEVTLRSDTLVIADEQKALAIAGVMGGLESAVSETTTNIIFESAHFSPLKCAGVARSYGLATDSSFRFERGVAPELQTMAMTRATELLHRFAGGDIGATQSKTTLAHLPSETTIALNCQHLNRVLGTDLSPQAIGEYLARLGFLIEPVAESEQLSVTVPAFRFDISIEADLIEEVARVFGYNAIPYAPIYAAFQAEKSSETKADAEQLRDLMVDMGYNESINYSFVCPNKQTAVYGESQPVDLLNPLSVELSQMRRGLWVGLLSALSFNQARQVATQKLFEIGLCFEKDNQQLKQINRIGGVIAGCDGEHDWSKSKHRYDFYDLKGDVELLLGRQSAELSFERCSHVALHPGKSAAIYLAGSQIGYIGECHPKLLKTFGLNQAPLLFELALDVVLSQTLPKYVPLSKFPSIQRDLSLLVDEKLTFCQIEQCIRSVSSEVPLQKLELFDVYQGDNLGKGKKSLAIGLTLQHPSRTLVDSEVNDYMSAILNILEKNFSVTLRE